MIGIQISITRYVSDEPQPGMVECELFDAQNRCWRFIEKTAVVCFHNLNGQSSYPQPGVIGCTIVDRVVDADGREVVTVDTSRPWGVESIDGQTHFDVLPENLVNWEWGTSTLKP